MDSIHIREAFITNGIFSISNTGDYVPDINGTYKDMINISFNLKSNNVNYCTVSLSDDHETIYFENFLVKGRNTIFFPIYNEIEIKKLILLCYNFNEEGKVLIASYHIYQYLYKSNNDIDNFFVNSSQSSGKSDSSWCKFEINEPSEEFKSFDDTYLSDFDTSSDNIEEHEQISINESSQYSQQYYDLLNGNTKTNKKYTNLCEDTFSSDEDNNLEQCMICISSIKPKDNFSVINDVDEDRQVYHTICLEEWLGVNRVGIVSKKKVKSYCTYNPNGKMIKLVILTDDSLYKRIANDKLKISYGKRLEENKNGDFSNIEKFMNDSRYRKRRVRCVIC